MAIFIQKISNSGGQYRVTLPKSLFEKSGLDKARVVEITEIEHGVIQIKEYHAKKRRKTRVAGHTAKTD